MNITNFKIKIQFLLWKLFRNSYISKLFRESSARLFLFLVRLSTNFVYNSLKMASLTPKNMFLQ